MEDQYILKTLENGLSILALFSSSQPQMTLKEIDEQLKLGKTRTFKLVRTLLKSGFLKECLPGPGYSLGPKIVSLGLTAIGRIEARRLALPILSELAQSTSETAILTMRSGDYSVVVEKVDSPLSVRMAAEIGARGRLHAGGSNVPLLAFGPTELRQRYESGAVALKRFTPDTVSDPETLLTTLDLVRKRGYHVSKGEAEKDIMAVGCPVFERNGIANFCISVAGPLIRMEPRQDLIIKEVVEAGRKLTSLLAI